MGATAAEMGAGVAPDAGTIMAAMRALVMVVDRSGRIVELRGPIEDLLNGDPAFAVGRPVVELVVAEDEALVRAAFDVAAAEADAVRHPVPFRLALRSGRGRPLAFDALVTVALDDPAIDGWVVTLVPCRPVEPVTEPLELLISGRDLHDVLASAASALTVPPVLHGEHAEHGVQHTVVLCDQLPETNAAPVPRPGRRHRDGLVATEATPATLLDAIVDCAQTDVQPIWKLTPVATVRELGLDELPLLVTAVARAHGLVAARMATVEVEGRVELVLLSFFDERAWSQVQGPWQPRYEQIVRVLTMALTHRRAQHRLELAATHDGLTGLANRQRFADALSAYRGDLAVLYLDVDRFQAINDRFGHFAGDRVLLEVARRLKHACRVGDLVGRLGGDEFGILLPAANAQEAVLVGRRIIEAVAAALPADIGPPRVGVSIGLARTGATNHAGRHPARAERLDVLDLAERAMSFAKRAGGGMLAVAPQPNANLATYSLSVVVSEQLPTDGGERLADR